jgi:hypothetical protein
MSRNALVVQGRAFCSGGVHMLAQDVFDTVSAESLATGIREYRVSRLAFSFPEPTAQSGYDFFAQWNTARFAPLASAAHMSAGPQRYVLTAQSDQLRNA